MSRISGHCHSGSTSLPLAGGGSLLHTCRVPASVTHFVKEVVVTATPSASELVEVIAGATAGDNSQASCSRAGLARRVGTFRATIRRTSRPNAGSLRASHENSASRTGPGKGAKGRGTSPVAGRAASGSWGLSVGGQNPTRKPFDVGARLRERYTSKRESPMRSGVKGKAIKRQTISHMAQTRVPPPRHGAARLGRRIPSVRRPRLGAPGHGKRYRQGAQRAL